MPNPESRQDSAVARFWDRYLEQARNQGVKPEAERWYVRRAEQYIQAFPDKRLAAHTVDDVTAYLGEIGRKDGLQDWQFRQVVVAIQNLFSMIEPEWANRFDWKFWLDSARTLAPQHATIARAPGASALAPEDGEGTDPQCAHLMNSHQEVFAAMAAVLRTRRMSIRTEKSYLHWLCRFMLYHGGRPPGEMGAAEVVGFLQHLAVERNVAASTQNQALNALVFLYDRVLEQPLGDLGSFVRAKRPKHLPVVLSPGEVKRVLAELEGVQGLIGALLYGTGMRLMECLRLRVQDVEFDRHLIVVRRGKGDKDRVVPLPDTLAPRLRLHLEEVRRLHAADLAEGLGEVYLPDALSVKYPNAAREWCWQYVFPSGRLSADPRSSKVRRHHLHEDSVQKAVRAAVRRARIGKRASCHTFRHSFATHLLERGHGAALGHPALRGIRPSWTSSAQCRSCWGMQMCPRP